MPYNSPVEFSPYTPEYVVLTNGLRVIPEAQQHRASCYSQSAWKNMSRGCLPQGGKPILLRDPKDYLTYAEICTLEHLPNKTKTDAYEFLCINIPREIIVDGRVQRTTFIRTFLDFETRNNLFAKSQGIHRSGVEILERFFMEYDLPVSHSQKERESLRHLVQRWRKEAEYLVQSPRIINDDLVTRIDDHEYTGGPPKYDDND